MNGNAKVADVTGGVLACVITAGVAVALTQALSPTYPFLYETDAAKRCGAIATAAFVVFLASSTVRRIRPDVALPITRRLAVAVALLAAYETLWFGVIAPRFIAGVPLPMIAGLAIEIFPLALIAALAWGWRTMRLGLRAAVFVVATILCVVAVAAMTPAVLRGVAEQSGWIVGSVHHVSGIHELPLPRHIAYIVLATLAGLPFARES
jgi:hypothetical protein